MKTNDKVHAWKSESAVDRIHGCKVMLHLHGFLTAAESKKVHQRILKWIERERKATE